MAQTMQGPVDQTTRCAKCGKRMVPVVTFSGRPDLQCISCDDPAVKWAESPVTAPEKPIVLDRLQHETGDAHAGRCGQGQAQLAGIGKGDAPRGPGGYPP